MWIVIAGVGCLLAMFAFLYNRLVALQLTRKNAFADIDVQLKMRRDLVPNLAEIVKKYAAHERAVFENVAAARAQSMQARTMNEKNAAEAALGQSLMSLLAVAENYPELKADQNFAAFQAELSGIEKSVAAARRFFNNATAEYNTAQRQLPAAIVAKLGDFREEEFFDLGDEKRADLDAPVAFAL